MPSLQECIALLNQLRKSPYSNGLVGLDIGAHRLKLIQIDPSEPQTIQHLAMSELPLGSIVNGEVKNYSAFGSTLKKMLSQHMIKSKNIAFAIPHMLTIVKNFTVDSRLSASEIESRTWLEANALFPDLVGNIYLDYVILEPSSQTPTKQEIMILACRRDHVKPYIDLLKNDGLRGVIIDVDCYVLQRALSTITKHHAPDEKIALLNLDLHLMTLIVTQNNDLTYVHEQNYKGNNLLEKIKNYLNGKGIVDMNPDSALSNDNDYMEIMKNGLGPYLRHTMQFFYSKNQSSDVKQIYLSGDLAIIPQLDKFIEESTNIKTNIANPFKDMQIAADIDEQQARKLAPIFMMSYGLALSKVAHYDPA